jgi:diguanylate cyclase (GGDEF)-like protein
LPANPSPAGATQTTQDRKKRGVYAEQIRVLYTNANAGVWVTAFVATLLSYLQWKVISHPIILAWLTFMLAVSSVRFILARCYWRAARADTNTRGWANTFTIGTGLSAVGWGVAGVVLYPQAQLANQVILAFVLGGMMLGAGSILAARPEAFLAFIIPTGVPVSVRFLLEGDGSHLAMGSLTTIFTAATLIATWRIYLTVRSSLNLRFEKEDLVVDLRIAKNHADTLNQELEARVQLRTVELHQTNERLRTEIEQRKQAEERLQAALAKNEHLAFHDALTDIPNRRLLEDRFEQALARADRQHHKAAVLALDLDNFKELNDTFGHHVGDLVLQSVVTRVKARLRASDTLARTGGDEFTVLAEVTDARGAQTLVSAVELAFAQPLSVDGKLMTVRASIGMALYPDDGRSSDALCTAADKAMYLAKRAKKIG